MALGTARLEAQAKALGGQPPSVEAFAAAIYGPPQRLRPENVETLRESPAEPKRSADAAARLLHRRSTGLLKTGFEPQRHSVIVAGRPVQVPAA